MLTLAWLIYGIIDEFKPIEKQKLIGQESVGYIILVMPCMIIDAIIISLLYTFIK